MFHARPDAAQVDRIDAVEDVGRLVGGVARRDLDAGVVERHVQPAEGVDRALDEGGDLVLVGHIAGHAERLITGGGQLVGRGTKRFLVHVGEHDGRAGFGEGLDRGEAHPGAGARDDGDLAVEVVGRVRVFSLIGHQAVLGADGVLVAATHGAEAPFDPRHRSSTSARRLARRCSADDRRRRRQLGGPVSTWFNRASRFRTTGA